MIARHDIARWVRRIALGVIVATVALASPAAPARVEAAGIVVNTLADAVPPVTDGLCSLREAMENAITNTGAYPDCGAGTGQDVITFSLGGTIVLADQELPSVTDPLGLIINGAGHSVTVTGGGTVRPFELHLGTLELRNMTITHGQGGGEGGGGILNRAGSLKVEATTITGNSASRGGGIFSQGGSVTITTSTISENTATGVILGGGEGGGLASDATASLVVTGSLIEKNEAPNSKGGGISAQGALQLIDSTVSENKSGLGGAGIMAYGTTLIERSTIRANIGASAGTNASGGGIHVHEGNLTLLQSAVQQNEADYYGGLVLERSTAVLANATISGNRNTDAVGGSAIYDNGSTVTLVNSTITANETPANNGSAVISSASITNSIVAGNIYDGCVEAFTQVGNNLLGSGGCPPSPGGDLLLGLLANNGGPTHTHALLPGSPAIDAGGGAACAAAPVNGLDQRGVPRPQGPHCDIGAYEAPPSQALSVSDASLPEGTAGATPFTFTLSLSAPSVISVTVHVTTAGGTASAPSDYNAVPDTLVTFAPGETSKQVTVLVNGDTTFEPNETFFVNLSNPTGAVIADGQGVGTILNDDIPGGRNLRITTGSIDLSWDTGTAQTGYYLLRYNTDTTAADLIPLAGNLTSYSDASAVNGTVYCYVLAAMNGGSVLGLSDLLCGLTGISSGTAVPGGFALALNQTANATLTWTPPAGGVGSYLLQRIPLDGTPISSVPLGAGVTSTTQAVTSAGTCFQLIAYRVLEFGTTNVLCGVPGVSTLSVGGRVASMAEVVERVAGVAGAVWASRVLIP